MSYLHWCWNFHIKLQVLLSISYWNCFDKTGLAHFRSFKYSNLLKNCEVRRSKKKFFFTRPRICNKRAMIRTMWFQVWSFLERILQIYSIKTQRYIELQKFTWELLLQAFILIKWIQKLVEKWFQRLDKQWKEAKRLVYSENLCKK